MACKNQKALDWVKEAQAMMTPDAVVWCDGSKAEYDRMSDIMLKSGSAIPIKKRPNCLHFRSDPSDVARVEDRTYISSKKKEDAGPTNNWIDPDELKKTMKGLYAGCMKGRTMYVIPFSMGPVGSPISKIGIQVTDSPYVVMNMQIMTRVGTKVLEHLGTDGKFIPCLHSIGAPLAPGQADSKWPCAPIEKKYIAHFPEEDLIWSYGSGYGGNALLGKKCFALRIASNIARREGDWMAEHMLIMRLTSPEGRRYHLCAAFPSACGKTNLAMLQPTIKGWKVETLGDDINWMKIGPDGYLHALNPEAGFFGVAPGTSYQSNPMAMECLKENVIFTNCVLTDDGDVWWEGMGTECKHGIDWKGQDWTPEKGTPGAHPNARFTAPARQCPIICADWENPAGVPVNIIVFGGRRATTCPLVFEAFGWDHGVFLGAQASSETTAANIGAVGDLRRDPMAMKPFCGYNMGDYWQHWLNMGDKTGYKAPRIFYVNWFRKNAAGKFMWPGYGENCRVLKWMCQRYDNQCEGQMTAIGVIPAEGELDLAGLTVDPANMKELMTVDKAAWAREIPDLEKHFGAFGDRLPPRIKAQVEAFKKRITA
jgi:phosphoenolpyruvate carboxykinase (GTP)